MGTSDEAGQLFEALKALIADALYEGYTTPKEMSSLFEANFHPDLKGLLSKVLAKQCDEWKNSVVVNQISPPRLVDFDWRVDIKTSSNHLSRMNIPTVFVGMKLQETPSQVGIMPGVKEVQFELSRESLQTMLDGLG